MRHNAPMQPLVFRSTVARVVAWIFIAFAAVNLVDVIMRGRGPSGRIAFAVLVALALIAFVLGLRPAVIADSREVRLRNLLRDVSVPWKAVTAIDTTDALRVHAGPAVFRSWSIAPGNRARRRALALKTDAAQGSAALIQRRQGLADEPTRISSPISSRRSGGLRGEAGGAPQDRWSWAAMACLSAAGPSSWGRSSG